MLKLNRIQCFLFGLLIISIFYLLNRSKYVFISQKVAGNFVYYVEEMDPAEGILVYPVIEYKYQDSVYLFKGREGSAFRIKETVPVLLQHEDPHQPLLFTLESFWLYPLFYTILPIILWAAFSLSYITKNEIVVINLKYPFFSKKKKNEDLILK